MPTTTKPYTCKRCQPPYTWEGDADNPPKTCPGCKSPYWQTEPRWKLFAHLPPITCPNETCGYTWHRTTEKPKTCPKCHVMLWQAAKPRELRRPRGRPKILLDDQRQPAQADASDDGEFTIGEYAV